MATTITFDAATNNAGNTTFSHTVGTGLNRILIVAVGIHNAGGITGVTYNSVAMTLAKTQSGSYREAYIYYLINPDSGAHDVVISGTDGGYGYAAVAASFAGVHQTTPIVNVAGGNGTSTTPSLMVISSVGSLVVDAVTHIKGSGTPSYAPGTDQTERGDTYSSSGAAIGVTTKEGAASVTMTQTATNMTDGNYAYVAVSLESAPPPNLDESFTTNDTHSVYNSSLLNGDSFSMNDLIDGHVVYEVSISESFSVDDTNDKVFGKTLGESFSIGELIEVTKDAGTASLSQGELRATIGFPTIIAESGIFLDANVTAPFPTVSAVSGNYSINSIAFPEFDGSAHTSIKGNGICVVPFPAISSGASIVTLGSVRATIVFPIIDADAHIGGANEFTGIVEFPQIISEGSVSGRFDSTIMKFTEK